MWSSVVNKYNKLVNNCKQCDRRRVSVHNMVFNETSSHRLRADGDDTCYLFMHHSLSIHAIRDQDTILVST